MSKPPNILTATLLLFSTAIFIDASQWNKLTRLTVNDSIAVPGAVLQPGEYVVKLADSPANRHIVRFMNGDQTEVIATVLAVPNKRMQPTGDTELSFYETPAGEPVALRAWFYPGDTFGQEFVYPESQAKRISGKTNRNVPATEDRLEATMRDRKATRDSGPPTDFESARIYSWGPQGRRDELESGFAENQALDNKMTRRSGQKARAQFRQESTRSRTTDRAQQSIMREVRHELVMLPYYGVFDNLAFRVDGSTVTLLGQVTRPTLKSSAENVVRAIEGVEQVRNEIDVLPVSPNDDDIRLATYRAIYGHTALNRYALQAVPPIHIIVKNGNVTLEGVVANEADKNIAGVQARSVSGVFSVTNNLRVENP
jgi:hyperosmotically inducible protein